MNALLVSGVGLGAAVLVRALWPDSAYVWFFGVALFGALFVWLMIFVTHIAFCAAPAGGAAPIASYVGAAADRRHPGVHVVGARSRSTLVAGGPWLLLLAIGYRLSPARARGI